MNMEVVEWENVNERWAEEFIYLRLPFFSIKKMYEKRNRTLFFFPLSVPDDSVIYFICADAERLTAWAWPEVPNAFKEAQGGRVTV
jgi:hypothetical protein